MTDIGKNIKKRRKELSMSVDDLAKKLNKNRATIYRYENGDIENLPTSILIPLADALKTTPAQLLGWENEEEMHDSIKNLYNEFDEINEYLKKTAVDNAELCATLIELLNIASQLPVEKIKPIIELLKTMQ